MSSDYVERDSLAKRQDFYSKGRAHEGNGQLTDAIEAYKQYSTWLKPTDTHIPHLWIAKLYRRLKNDDKVVEHLIKYAEGCTSVKALDEVRKFADMFKKESKTAHEKAIAGTVMRMTRKLKKS